MPRAMTLARTIARQSPVAVRSTVKTLRCGRAAFRFPPTRAHIIIIIITTRGSFVVNQDGPGRPTRAPACPRSALRAGPLPFCSFSSRNILLIYALLGCAAAQADAQAQSYGMADYAEGLSAVKEKRTPKFH